MQVFGGGLVGGSLPGDCPERLTSGYFVRSEGDRLIMGFGGAHENPGYNESLDWSWLEHVMEAGMNRFPWIVDLPMDQAASWPGTYDMSPDHRPVIGRMPEVSSWVNACGFSGHGVMQDRSYVASRWSLTRELASGVPRRKSLSLATICSAGC